MGSKERYCAFQVIYKKREPKRLIFELVTDKHSI